ncbi:lipopolysaccharide biosynthesis protein [Phocaeicola sp.]
MATTAENNKRIAKNTLLLYVRMLFTMAVSLYTSRVVLNALGVEDFGIYNVVGGVVAMFSVLSGSLSAAISRFITFELGKGNKERLNTIFSSAVTIQIGLSLIIVLIAETAGLWFLNAKMNIPADRMVAANWVLQFSIITFVINLISIPYNAAIIAHEKMSAFAYISILEVIGKLLIAYLITICPIDKLVAYGILMCAVAFTIRLTYGSYCKRHFKECTYHFVFDKILLKQMFSFAGWNFIGASSAVLRDQGGNVVINLFCGPTVNAARGIAFQVNNAIHGFVSNFMTALNPQITKSYASGDHAYMITLVYQGARLSFYMLLLLSLPVLINTHFLLTLWLKIVPEHTVLFVQLVLLFAMSESISSPLITTMLATGKIRNYQIIVGGLQMLNLPISYLLLRMGAFPEIIIVVAIILSQCCLAARLYMLRRMIGLNISEYIKKVYINVITVSVIACIIPLSIQNQLSENFIHFLFSCFICALSTLITIYFIGCNHKERVFVCKKVNTLKQRILKK